jgi:hypothetical protein
MSSHGLTFDKLCAISRLHAFKLCITKAEQTAARNHCRHAIRSCMGFNRKPFYGGMGCQYVGTLPIAPD